MYKIKAGVIILIAILLLSLSVVYSKDKSNKINQEVHDLLKNNQKIRVIVEFHEDNSIFFKKDMNQIKNDFLSEVKPKKASHDKNSVSIEIKEKDLEKLEKNNDIESIIIDQIASIFLQDSVPQINATVTWPLQTNGINLTGAGQTVCIIDTGINSTHPDLLNKTIHQYCYCSTYEGSNLYCCPDGNDESTDGTDTNSHGTHVSGIVSANGTIKGVAPNTQLVVIKTMNSSGSGYYSDIKKAIDRCVTNSSLYNISIISLSLGSGGYSAYCNTDYLATSINSAIAKNISVIVSTGNSGSTTQISSPACVQNATAVSAVSKLDVIASAYANRNSITDLVAPGGTSTSSQTKINSTYRTGGYYQAYGTSMAAPHVSGAFAIIRQFFISENNRVPTSQEIQNILNKTGKQIYDSGTGLNFSRIDLYSAIISIDNTLPNVTLSYPADNYLSQEKNLNFSCNVSDNLQLKNITLTVWDYQGNTYYNSTNTTSFNYFSLFINLTNVSYGNYKWNCLAYDMAGNSSYASSNFSFYIGNISSTLISPTNNYISNNATNNFSCFSQTANIFSLSNITFYLWNSSDSLINESTINISGTTNLTYFNYTFTNQGNYSWNCIALNNISQSSQISSNYTIIFHNTTPVITSITSSVTSTTATITWTTDENTNSTINYGINTSLGTISSNQTQTTNKSIVLSSLSSSTGYYYNLTSCNAYNLCVTNGTYSFTTSAAATQESSGGGGGGGGGESSTTGGGSTSEGTIYVLTTQETLIGTTKSLSGSDKISFTIQNNNTNKNETHTLLIESILNNSIKIKIQSITITDELSIGETGKYELTGDDIYDIQVTLNSIISNKSSLTIKTISEKIIAQTQKEINGNESKTIENNSKDTTENLLKENKSELILTIIILITITIVITIVLIIINKYKPKKPKIGRWK